MVVRQPLRDILTHIPLHRNLLAPTRRLRHARSRREFLPKLLRHLLQIESKLLQARDFGDIFPLVALDALDGDFRRGALFCLASFGCGGFGGFLLGVFFGAFLGVDTEGAEVGREGFGAVEAGVEVRVGGGEPVGAAFGGAAVFAVLLSEQVVSIRPCEKSTDKCCGFAYLLLGGACIRHSR